MEPREGKEEGGIGWGRESKGGEESGKGGADRGKVGGVVRSIGRETR